MSGTGLSLPPPLLRKLRGILPAGGVLTGDDALPFGTDRWFASVAPGAAVFPKTTTQVSRVLAACHAAGIPVTARGAGYGYVGGCVPQKHGLLLSLERMNRIKEISTPDFVAVVEPGVITGKLQSRARAKGLMYPPDPASLKDCSIGGNIATNAGGPRCLKYGVTRQYILGLEVVLMDGRILRVGGRTHKNKTGFDLVGLFTGAEGLLGVITEATLKLLPHPPFRGAISAGFRDIRAAAAAVQAVFRHGFLPAALEIADDFTLHAARSYRPEANFPPGNAHLLLEVDGQERSVRSELRDLARLLLDVGSLRVDVAHGDTGCEAIWDIRRVFSQSLKATGLRKLNEDVVVPRGRLVDLVRFARRLSRRSGFPIACFGHAGDGNIHTNIMVGQWDDVAVRQRAEAALDELFQQVLEWGGAITGEHGIGLAKLPWWPKALSSEVRNVHREIKLALDPKNLLNPGKFA
jgi:glycolate oxidase